MSEIVHELSPAELVKLLKAVWDTLINHPPQVAQILDPKPYTLWDTLIVD